VTTTIQVTRSVRNHCNADMVVKLLIIEYNSYLLSMLKTVFAG